MVYFITSIDNVQVMTLSLRILNVVGARPNLPKSRRF